MKSFQFLRKMHRTGALVPEAAPSTVNSGFHDSKPMQPKPDPRGWFDSSADLRGGLHVQEEDFDSLPEEFRDVFSSR